MDILARNRSGWSLLEVKNIEEWEMDNYNRVTGAYAIVCIKGRYLIGFNNWRKQWGFPAGGIEEGEAPKAAAERELWEELGLKIDLRNVRPHLTINFDTGFDDVYLIEKEVDLNELKLQYEEVQQVKWASVDEIYRKLDEGIFIPYYKSAIQLFFDIRKQYGCHRVKDTSEVEYPAAINKRERTVERS